MKTSQKLKAADLAGLPAKLNIVWSSKIIC